MFVALGLLLAVTQVLAADQPVWSQCGGIGWTGSKTCVSGTFCNYQNAYYSQCIPGTASTTATTTTTTTTTTSSTTSTTTTAPPTSTNKYWFSFGDSYTQTGFVINGTLPSATNPLGNPTYPGSTACGSYNNWIDLITTTYKTSTTLTYNFAYGGATIDRNLVAPYAASVVCMTEQVNQFLSTVGKKPTTAPWTSSNSIFSFFIGINDIGGSWANSGDRDAFSDTLLNAYFALVQKVYAIGGRNFLFINVPGVDRSPLNLAQSAANQAAEKLVIDHFNTKLAAKVTAWKAANADTQTWLYNSHDKLVTMLNAPATYGFKDATSYSSATNVMWCNTYHISPKVHDYYAQDIAALIKGGF